LVVFRRDTCAARRARSQWLGGYIDTVIAIEDGFVGQGLSAALVLRAYENRELPAERQLTTAGYGALSAAHRVAVERAIRDGANVPESVRRDYEED
jgi:hypothetical protein